MAEYTQDQINAAYASEKARGYSDADIFASGAAKFGIDQGQFNLATAAYGPGGGGGSASAPVAAAADPYQPQDYENGRNWASGKTFDEIGAKALELKLTPEQLGRMFGKHGGSGEQVMNASRYGTAGWDGFQDEAAKWTYNKDTESGWSRAPDKKPPTTGINLSQLQGMTRWDVAPNETVRSQLQQIIADDSPLMQQARARAQQTANSRGLLNSSMAMTAADSAMYDAAMPIAQQDASTYARSGEFNANTANTFSRDNNAFVRDAYMADFNVQANEWAAQQQFDRDYKALDRQQQLTLERDAIQNGYQSARDQFAADQQWKVAQLDAASRAAAIQPDTSMARLNAQLDADDRRADRQTASDDRATLNNLRTDYAAKVFQINTADLSPEKADRAIADLASTYNPQLTVLANRLGYNPDSWIIKTEARTDASASSSASRTNNPYWDSDTGGNGTGGAPSGPSGPSGPSSGDAPAGTTST